MIAAASEPLDRHSLVTNNIGLIGHVIKQVARTHPRVARMEYAEQWSAGQVGLVAASQKFDPARGVVFATFACLVIGSYLIGYSRRRRYHTKGGPQSQNGSKPRFFDDVLVDECMPPHDEIDIRRLLEPLSHIQRTLVTRHFGLFGCPRVMQKDLATEMGVSSQRVQYIIQQSLRKMRGIAAEYDVADFGPTKAPSAPLRGTLMPFSLTTIKSDN